MVVSFVGHGNIYGVQELHPRLSETIRVKILEKNKERTITFYCGGYGDFDLLCARVLGELRQKGYSFECFYVTPYLGNDSRLQDKMFLKHYDGVLYPPLETTPPRLAILKRNQWMVDNSDLVLCYVLHSYGGAAKTRAYAQKRKKSILDFK